MQEITTNDLENNDRNIADVFEFLDEKFLKEYDDIEVASNLPDGTYAVLVTKSEVKPVTKPSTGKTISLNFSAKVLSPQTSAGKVFQYDFTMNENNKTMMKKMFFALGFEFDFRNQLAAFTRLVGSELEIRVSTNGQFQNSNIRRVSQQGEMLVKFLAEISEPQNL